MLNFSLPQNLVNSLSSSYFRFIRRRKYTNKLVRLAFLTTVLLTDPLLSSNHSIVMFGQRIYYMDSIQCKPLNFFKPLGVAEPAS